MSAQRKHIRTYKSGVEAVCGNKIEMISPEKGLITIESNEDINLIYDLYSKPQVNEIEVKGNFMLFHKFFFEKACKKDKTLKIDNFSLTQIKESIRKEFPNSFITTPKNSSFFNFSMIITKNEEDKMEKILGTTVEEYFNKIEEAINNKDVEEIIFNYKKAFSKLEKQGGEKFDYISQEISQIVNYLTNNFSQKTDFNVLKLRLDIMRQKIKELE